MRPLAVVCCVSLLFAPVTGAAVPSAGVDAPDRERLPSPAGQAGPGDGTLFEPVEAENAGFVVRVDLSLLTSFFRPGSTLRIVTGGTANGERVVWFDIGIGHAGGPDTPPPGSGLVVRADMSMNFPA